MTMRMKGVSKMQRRIKIVMVDMKEYDEHFNKGFENYPNIHHILLSNCHRNADWIEKSVDKAVKKGRDTLMIGVDE